MSRGLGFFLIGIKEGKILTLQPSQPLLRILNLSYPGVSILINCPVLRAAPTTWV
ncbi:MAG: hypothetical protein GTO17_03105 [Candidatus Aminicenantes bacterium]|nr:hypothetical protein [Candidatus Aminicenantes bacterium]